MTLQEAIEISHTGIKFENRRTVLVISDDSLSHGKLSVAKCQSFVSGATGVFCTGLSGTTVKTRKQKSGTTTSMESISLRSLMVA
jgi:hypothetical protein